MTAPDPHMSTQRAWRWLRRIAIALALLIVASVGAIELAYRAVLWDLPRPQPPALLLPPLALRAFAVEMAGSASAHVEPLWPWRLAGTLALALAHDHLPRQLRAQALPKDDSPSLPLSPIASRAVRDAGFKGQQTFRRFALMIWISRHWTDAEAIAGWAEAFDFSSRSRSMFGKEVSALAPGELAAAVVLSRGPSRLSRSPKAWRHARQDLLQRMRSEGLLDAAAVAVAAAVDLPAVAAQPIEAE